MKRMFLVLLAVMLLWTAGASAETWAETYARAGAAYEAGRLEEASALYLSIPEYRDSKLKARQIKAETLFMGGEYARAWDIFAALGDGYHTKDAEYEAMYADAADKRAQGAYAEAQLIFASLGAYRDSALQLQNTVLRQKADELLESGGYDAARALYQWLQEDALVSECVYRHAAALSANGEYIASADAYATLKDYKDSGEKRYQVGISALNAGMVEEAWTILDASRDYKDPTEDLYRAAVAAGSRNELSVAVPIYQKLGNYKDCAMRIAMVGYQYGAQLYDEGEYLQAGNVFNFLGKLSDAESRTKVSWYAAANAKFDEGAYAEAIDLYALVPGYENSAERTQASRGFILMAEGKYEEALKVFSALGDFEDSQTQVSECRYQMALAQKEAGEYLAAAAAFDGIAHYRDSAELARESRYTQAGLYENAARYDDASALLDDLAAQGYKDSAALARRCHYLRAEEHLAAGATEMAYNEYVKAGDHADAVTKRGKTASDLALAATQAGDYQGAIAWYVRAGEYEGAKESIEFIGEYYLMTAQYDLAYDTLMKVKELDAAKAKLTELGLLYYNSDKLLQAAACFEASGYTGKEYAAAAAAAAAAAREAKLKPYKTVGSYVTFGQYPQTAGGMDSTAIEWMVLEYDAENNRSLLLSRYGLDAKPYNSKWISLTWEECTLRTWLNGEFLNKAFTAQEQAGILLTNVDNSQAQGFNFTTRIGLASKTDGGNNTQDKVFLLSCAEANKYLGVTYDNKNNTKSQVAPTAYAIKQGAFTNSDYKTADGTAAGWWWLRSPGGNQDYAAVVYTYGSLLHNNVNLTFGTVRPALWVNLESDIF